MFRGNEIDLAYVVMVSVFAAMLRKPILLPPHNPLNILFYVYKPLCMIIYHISVMVLTFSKTVIVL